MKFTHVVLLAVIVFLCMPLLAEDTDVSFALGTIDTSDLLSGALPTYVEAGVTIGIPSIVGDRKSELSILLGGARTAYTLATDIDGNPLTTYSGVDMADLGFAIWQGNLSVQLTQEIADDTELFAAWKLLYALPVEDIAGGAAYILDPLASSTAYPDKDGMLANIMSLGGIYDTVSSGAMRSGISVSAELTVAPALLLNELIGRTDFYQVNITGEGFFPLYRLPGDAAAPFSGSWLSLYLADRVSVDYLTGSAVPQLYQEYPSLGKKMRGFADTELGSAVTAVNNLELRASGPVLNLFDMNIGYPRAHLFLDIGYAGGPYYNVAAEADTFAASTGIEVAVDILEFLDIGYRYGFILAGTPISGETSFGKIFLFLHW